MLTITDWLSEIGIKDEVAEDERINVRLLHKTNDTLDVLITPMSDSHTYAYLLKAGSRFEEHHLNWWDDTVKEEKIGSDWVISIGDQKLPYHSTDRFPRRIVSHTLVHKIETGIGRVVKALIADYASYQDAVDRGRSFSAFQYARIDYELNKQFTQVCAGTVADKIQTDLTIIFADEQNPSRIYVPSMQRVAAKMKDLVRSLKDSVRYFHTDELIIRQREEINALDDINPQAARFMRAIYHQSARYNRLNQGLAYASHVLIGGTIAAVSMDSRTFAAAAGIYGMVELAHTVLQHRRGHARSLYSTIRSKL